MKRKTKAILPLLLAAVLLFTGIVPCAAVSAGSFPREAENVTVTGSYTVPSLPPGGASVEFVSEDGARYRFPTLDAATVGSYSASVPAGRYDVTVSRAGCLKQTIRNVLVSNMPLSLDHGALTPGDLNGDGIINLGDLFAVRRSFQSLLSVIDLDGSGAADEKDADIIKRNLRMKNSVSEYTGAANLTCDYRRDPLGIDDQTPYLSWEMSSAVRGQKQTACRIVVSSDREKLLSGDYDMWDYTIDGVKSGIDYAGKSLLPRSEYYWTVFLTDKDGNVLPADEIGRFETGLFGDFGEDNKWIAASGRSLENTSGAFEVDCVLDSGAVGINFCQSADGTRYLMWQINVTSGKVMFRPHTVQNVNFSVVSEVDLSRLFPTPEDIIGKPFTLRMEIDGGTVVTSINGTEIHTFRNPSFSGRMGAAELRVAGGEHGSIRAVRAYDADGALLYETSAEEDYPLTAPLFRREFSLEEGKTPSKARLYATAAGTHEMYLNGARCGDDYLAPGKSEYNESLYYQTYDVTDLLLAGENTLACQLGIGWYNGGPIGSSYGNDIGLKAKLMITYTDGTEQVIDTDDSWLSTKNGPVICNRFYTGEYIDGRRIIDGWNENGLDTSLWGGVRATDKIGAIQNHFYAENTNPIRVVRTTHPVEVTHPADKIYVYRFPENMSATLRITAQAPANTTIDLRYSEVLTSSGRVDVVPCTVNPANGDQNGEDKYIFAGKGDETFTFTFVYHGFQFLEIEGLDAPIAPENITALVLSTDNERTGSFECSNELLNGYYANVIRSQQSNFIGAITDCPSREKNNWTGDAQGFATAANYNFKAYATYRAFQEMTRQAQGVSGVIPEVVPLGGSKPGESTKTPSGWSDTVIMIPWQMYYMYGDLTFLSENYEPMKKWADYLIRTCAPNDYVRRAGWYGDNTAFDRTLFYEENYPEIGTAYSAYSIGILADIADILGVPDEAAYYRAESEKFAAAWRKNFLEADGATCKTNAQTSYAMGIYYDLYETPEQKQKAADLLAQLIAKGDASKNIPPYCQSVGFIGYPILYDALAQNGHVDTVFRLLEQTECPSILYPVTQGATTTWEYYVKGASLNHFFSGCVTAWLYSSLLGISHDYDVENAGFTHFVLRPTVGGSLTYAEGSYHSQAGQIESGWRLSDDGKTLTYTCTVPANTGATLKLPKAAGAVVTESGVPAAEALGVTYLKEEDGRIFYELASGEYTFTVTEG